MNISDIKARPGWTIIEPLSTSNVSKGGLIIPDTVKQKASRGKIITLSPFDLDDILTADGSQAKPGDTALFSKDAAQPFKLGDQDLLLVRCRDLQALLP